MADFIVGSNGEITVGKKKKKANFIVDEKGNVKPNEKVKVATETVKKGGSTVTQKKSEKEKKSSWFSSGSFSDGYQFGDLTKTFFGTGQDITEDLYTGAIGIAEKTIDAGAYVYGGVAGKLGFDNQQKKAEEFIKKDLIDEKQLAKYASWSQPTALINKIVAGDKSEDYSVFGEKSDSLVQSAGQLAGTVGLQSVGVPWWLTTGATSFGGEVEQALNSNATYGEAGFSGLVTAGAEILTEKISGGISFGGKTLDTGLKNLITKNISNKTIQNLTKWGLDISLEGGEEVASEFLSTLGKQLSYEREETWDTLLSDEEAMDTYIAQVGESLFGEEARQNYKDAWIGGAVLGGGANVGRVVSTTKQGRDYDTGYTNNEQNVIDKEIERRVVEAEAEGTKLTKKQKAKIEEEVNEDFKKGVFSTDAIESTLGGETYAKLQEQRNKRDELKTEIDSLLNKKSSEITVAENRRLEALEQELSTLDINTLEKQLQAEMSQKIEKDNYLKNAYHQKAQRSRVFEYEVSENDREYKHAVYQSAVDSEANNTLRTHEMADTLVKLSEDRGIQYKFTNTKQLQEQGLVPKGKTANGLYVVENDGKREVLVNLNSKKYLEAVLIHETAHDFKTTDVESYEELQEITRQFAEAKGDYSRIYSEVVGMYKDIDGVNINEEVTSRLLEDYLGNKEFINDLSTKKPSIVKKFIDSIKNFYKRFTASSPEARKIEKLRQELEEAYKKAYRQTEVKGDTDARTQHSFMSERGLERAVESDQNNSVLVKDLLEAKKLKKQGKDNEYIRQNTGWFQDANGKWLFEIVDTDVDISKDILEPNKTYNFEDLLPHNDLFEVYPEIKGIEIITKDIDSTGHSGEVMGQYDDETGQIYISNDVVKKGDTESIRNILLHEAQHKIQEIEGLQNGSESSNPIRYYTSLGEIWATDVETRSRKDVEWLKSNMPEVGKKFPIHQQLKDIHDALNSSDSKLVGRAKRYLENDSRLEKLYNEIYNNGKEGEYNRALLNKMGITKETTPSEILREVADWFNKRSIRGRKNKISQKELLDSSFFDEENTTSNPDIRYSLDIDNQTLLERNAIADHLKKKGATVDENGNVTLYHITTPENFNKITSDKQFIPNQSPIGGGTVLGDIGDRSFFTYDEEWVETWRQSEDSIVMELKVPAEYVRQGAKNEKEIYIEGVLKQRDNGIWTTDEKPTSTFYDRLAVKRYLKDNPDINLSLSNENDIAPVNTETQTSGQDLIIEETIENAIAPLQEEIAQLRESLQATIQEGETNSLVEADSNALNTGNEYAPLTEDDLPGFYEARDNAPLLDAPPEVETVQDSLQDSISMDKKTLKSLSKNIKNELGLNRTQTSELENVIQEFSKNEVGTREELFNTIKDRFSEQNIEYKNEEISAVKSFLRNYPIKVSEYLKSEYKDGFNKIRQQNFNKLRFYNNGTEVDSAYEELNSMFPGYFPSDITNAQDQLNKIIEVANQDAIEVESYVLDDATVRDISDFAYDSIQDYRLDELMKMVEQHRNAPIDESLAPVEETITEEIAPISQMRSIEETLEAMDRIEPIDLENSRQLTIEGTEEDLVTKTKRELRRDLMGTEIQREFIIDALDNAKNRSMILMNNTDTIRNNELVFGREAGKIINETIFQKEIDNEADSIAWQNKERAEIKALGIKPRSKESSAVQKYGEKQYVNDFGEVVPYGDAQLIAEFKDVATQEKIKNASQVIRNKYDTYIDTANGVLTKLGFEPIKKRQDYMRHFQELNDVFSRYGIPFNAQSMSEHVLPTDINGLTEFWSPQKNYFANMQARKGVKTTYDAITGIDGYISGISNLIFHTEDIQRGRAFEELIRETYGEDKGFENLENLPEELQQARAEKIQDNHLSNYVAWVHEWTNNVAGKKNKIDRSIESVFGRKAFSFLDNTRKQVGANMIGFNLSSSLTNLIAPVQAMSKTKKLAVLKGTADTIKNMFVKDDFMSKNKFLTSRMGTDMLSKNAWQKVQDAGFVFMKGLDWFSSNQIVRSKYYELRAKGMSEEQAHAEAGQFGARIMGDRTKGANAQLYNSKMLGLVTQFQLEVNNQLYSQFYDTYHESKENAKNNAIKTTAGMVFTLGQLYAFTHLFGQTFEAIAGYNPTFDVIEILKTAFGWGDEEDEEKTWQERLKEASDLLVDDLPYVNILTGGGRIPVASGLPNLVGVATGGKDEYGNELTLEDEMKKLLYLVPPTGGNQLKKTYQGLSMYDEDLPVKGSYTDSGNLRFPIEDTLGNRIQSALFGQWANENARDYFDNKRKPLKEKQIEEYADLELPIADYWEYREGLSKQKTIEDKFEYVNNLDVTDNQKNIMINNIVDRDTKIDMSNYDDFGSYEEFDFYLKNPEKYDFLEKNNISYGDYEATEESRDAYNWAFNNQESYVVSKAVSNDIVKYRQYASDLNDLKADKGANGKTINGSRKEKVVNYINTLDIDYGSRLILYKKEYPSDDTHNMDIVNYLMSRDDISYEETVTILTELDMKVDLNGNVRW